MIQKEKRKYTTASMSFDFQKNPTKRTDIDEGLGGDASGKFRRF